MYTMTWNEQDMTLSKTIYGLEFTIWCTLRRKNNDLLQYNFGCIISIVECSITHPTRRFPSIQSTCSTTVLHPSEMAFLRGRSLKDHLVKVVDHN